MSGRHSLGIHERHDSRVPSFELSWTLRISSRPIAKQRHTRARRQLSTVNGATASQWRRSLFFADEPSIVRPRLRLGNACGVRRRRASESRRGAGLRPRSDLRIARLARRPVRAGARERCVVIVDVFTFECTNCTRVTPNLKALYRAYPRERLVIVGFHTPEVPSYDRDRYRLSHLARVRRRCVADAAGLRSAREARRAYRRRFAGFRTRRRRARGNAT